MCRASPNLNLGAGHSTTGCPNSTLTPNPNLNPNPNPYLTLTLARPLHDGVPECLSSHALPALSLRWDEHTGLCGWPAPSLRYSWGPTVSRRLFNLAGVLALRP